MTESPPPEPAIERDSLASTGPASRAAPRRDVWLPLAVLPLVEYLLLSFAVDAPEIRFLPATEHLGSLGRFGVCVATALLLVGGRELATVLEAGRAEASAWSSRVGALAVHGAAYGLFFALTVLTSRGLPPAGLVPDAALGVTWVGLCGATVVTWAALAFPLALRRWALTHGVRAAALAVLIASASSVAGVVFERNWPTMARFTLYVAEALLSLGEGRHWSRTDTPEPELGIDDFHVRIAPVCSGADGMGLMAVLLSAYLVLFRRELRFPHALVALPLGLAAAYLGNAARIAALVWVGRYVSAAVALRGFHSKAGWVAFCAVALLVVSFTRRTFARAAPESRPLVEGPVEAYIGPELALLATSLLTGLFAAGPDALYGLRVVAAGAVLVFSWRVLRGTASISALPVAVGAAVYAAWWLLADDPLQDPVLEAFLTEHSPLAAGAWLTARVLGMVVVVPLAEELAFRGFLLRWSERRDFESFDPRAIGFRGVALSSLAFGALHSSFVAATLAGAAYAFVYRRRGRLFDAVLAHAVTNALLAAEGLALGHYGRF